MPWAKLHTDILGDPKLMRAARKGARGLVYLPWIIAFAKQADDEGRLTVGGEAAETDDIAALVPGASEAELADGLTSLLAIGVLEDVGGILCFTRWEDRSGSRDSDSSAAVYERVKKHRRKQREARAASRNGSANTLAITSDNALQSPLSVTNDNAREKRRIEKRRGEQKREEETGPQRAVRAPRVTPTAAPWVAPIRDRWIARVGDIAASSVVRHLGSAVALHGEPAVLAAIDVYADVRLAAEKPCKLEWFADEASLWVERSTEHSAVDAATGLPNERGMAVLTGPTR